jgi:hypothetical protein
MKKLFAVLAIVSVMTSCKDEKTETTVETPTETPTTTEPTTTEPTATTGVPTFSDADVQAYANAYAELAEAYKKAADSKDMAKFTELSNMGQDLATKSAAMTQKLATSPEEAKKLSDFLLAKSNEIVEATKKLTGQ